MRKFPWKDWTEWEQAYSSFFAYLDPEIPITAHDIIPPTTSHKQQFLSGIRLVSLWQLRGHVPKMAEITKNIFSLWIHMLDQAPEADTESLRYLASAHIIRAVNAISDHFRISRTKSISTIAGEIRLPQLLVDLRHDATHKDMPSLEVLKAGLCELLKWIYLNYWQVQYTEIQKEAANCTKLISFIENFGKNPEEMSAVTHEGKAEKNVTIEGIMEVIHPFCAGLNFEGKCKVVKCLIKEILNSIEYKIKDLPGTIKTFLMTDQFAVSQLKKKTELKISRTTLYIAVIKCLESYFKEHIAKIVQAVALDEVIKHARDNVESGYEESIRYALMYKYISKHSGIQLKSLTKSSAGLRKKIKLIGRLRWINLAAQAVFSTVSKKMQQIATGEAEYSDKGIADAISSFEKGGSGKIDHKKCGSLLEKTYKKRTATEREDVAAMQEEVGINELFGKRKIICIKE